MNVTSQWIAGGLGRIEERVEGRREGGKVGRRRGRGKERRMDPKTRSDVANTNRPTMALGFGMKSDEER